GGAGYDQSHRLRGAAGGAGGDPRGAGAPTPERRALVVDGGRLGPLGRWGRRGGGGRGRGRLRGRVRRLWRWRWLQRRRRRREFLTMAKPISVDDFAKRLDAALGGRLVSLLLYGSAARGTHVAGRSDVNTLLICDAADESLFAAL